MVKTALYGHYGINSYTKLGLQSVYARMFIITVSVISCNWEMKVEFILHSVLTLNLPISSTPELELHISNFNFEFEDQKTSPSCKVPI